MKQKSTTTITDTASTGRKLLRLLSAAVGSICIVGGFAIADNDTSGQSSNSAENTSMMQFLRDNPDCLEFSDECSFCAKDKETINCSTPQIACIKRDYSCTKAGAAAE